LFIAPPLIVTEEELDTFFDALHNGLELADEEHGRGTDPA
jgi:adenosylmethionine-8-amino-7-oxononanoate aminotransferase